MYSNCPHGNVGLKAVDGVDAIDRIKFLPADEFYYPRSSIKVSSRLMTYVNIPELDTKQGLLNSVKRPIRS